MFGFLYLALALSKLFHGNDINKFLLQTLLSLLQLKLGSYNGLKLGIFELHICAVMWLNNMKHTNVIAFHYEWG
jgi:hypothetical protein